MEPTLGSYIRELRNNRDLSLRELSKLIDKSPSMISEIETGNRFPSDEMMAALARALRTTVDDLRRYDVRPRKREVNQLVMQNPDLGWVFRTVIDKTKAGATPAQLTEWLDKMPGNFKQEGASSDPNE
jgi:XRE family transcriptional regulator, fatty acid utilization regulator